MSESKESPCIGGPTLIFACSGAADVGALADLAARKLTAEGTGKMYCLAGIGGKVKGIIETTQSASKILAIDGCPLDCTKLCLEDAGFHEFEHIKVTDLGLEKGNSPASDDNILKVTKEAYMRLGS